MPENYDSKIRHYSRTISNSTRWMDGWGHKWAASTMGNWLSNQKERKTLNYDWCSNWSSAIHLFYVFFSIGMARVIALWQRKTLNDNDKLTLPLVLTFNSSKVKWNGHFQSTKITYFLYLARPKFWRHLPEFILKMHTDLLQTQLIVAFMWRNSTVHTEQSSCAC